MDRLSDLLGKNIEKSGIKPHLGRAHALQVFIMKAKEVLPASMHDTFRPMHLTNGVLTVACKTAATAALLRAHEKELTADIGGEGEAPRLRTVLSTWQ